MKFENMQSSWRRRRKNSHSTRNRSSGQPNEILRMRACMFIKKSNCIIKNIDYKNHGSWSTKFHFLKKKNSNLVIDEKLTTFFFWIILFYQIVSTTITATTKLWLRKQRCVDARNCICVIMKGTKKNKQANCWILCWQF